MECLEGHDQHECVSKDITRKNFQIFRHIMVVGDINYTEMPRYIQTITLLKHDPVTLDIKIFTKFKGLYGIYGNFIIPKVGYEYLPNSLINIFSMFEIIDDDFIRYVSNNMKIEKLSLVSTAKMKNTIRNKITLTNNHIKELRITEHTDKLEIVCPNLETIRIYSTVVSANFILSVTEKMKNVKNISFIQCVMPLNYRLIFETNRIEKINISKCKLSAKILEKIKICEDTKLKELSFTNIRKIPESFILELFRVKTLKKIIMSKSGVPAIFIQNMWDNYDINVWNNIKIDFLHSYNNKRAIEKIISKYKNNKQIITIN